MQGVERIGDAWVLYSTGNFAFPSAHVRWEVLAMLSRRSQGLAFDDDGRATATTAPSECSWSSLDE